MTDLFINDCSYDCPNIYTRNQVICDNNCTNGDTYCGSSYNRQQKIQGTVGVSSSEYAMNKSTVITSQDRRCQSYLNNNRASDRNEEHQIPLGMNLSRQRTRIRPGGLQPVQRFKNSRAGPGGVDVKHNHYARYLARKKQHAVRAETPTENYIVPIMGNKLYKFSIIGNKTCV